MSTAPRRLSALVLTLMLVAAACATGDGGTASSSSPSSATTASSPSPVTSEPGTCESIVTTFRSVVSADADLPDPELSTTCDGSVVTVTSNGIPDYTYVETSPGEPTVQDLTFKIPVAPVVATTPGEVARLGSIAVAVNGVPIYGPTEGTGGDVLSLDGALSHCGSHNGPTGFHIHLFGYADGVDCLFSVDEVATGSAQIGWSPDGYPIMSGVVCADEACATTQQLTSSWSLTDESSFATDTWSAHTYVEGSGDLDQCNGRTDSDGQYRYYTTTTFPYILGCYHGEVADGAIPGAGGGGAPAGAGAPAAPPAP